MSAKGTQRQSRIKNQELKIITPIPHPPFLIPSLTRLQTHFNFYDSFSKGSHGIKKSFAINHPWMKELMGVDDDSMKKQCNINRSNVP